MASIGITPPEPNPATQESADGPVHLLNKPVKRALSELSRRSATSLPAFLELLQKIAREGVQVRLKEILPRQSIRPPNHGSARDTINVLRKDIRKEQDAWKCLVLDMDLLEQWPQVIISSFGVVDKGSEDSNVSGHTIHDLSYPEGSSISYCTDQDSTTKPDYNHGAAVARAILKAKQDFPGAVAYVMAEDVATAFRNISIYSNSAYLLAGLIEEENALVIELSAPFGWTRFPGFYEIFGGAISHVHGCHTNAVSPAGFFSYHWVDDHINVTAGIGTAFNDKDRPLRSTMMDILGADAINTKKFTEWKTRQRVLGLEFDSIDEVVAIPSAKIQTLAGLLLPPIARRP
ncbi:hypothetical protein PC128_g1525 [Phytophthora cactorum]|nr:hypothetical protein PC128_g1525 [Phytophthora cactorum]